jgi:hypothetical protein
MDMGPYSVGCTRRGTGEDQSWLKGPLAQLAKAVEAQMLQRYNATLNYTISIPHLVPDLQRSVSNHKALAPIQFLVHAPWVSPGGGSRDRHDAAAEVEVADVSGVVGLTRCMTDPTYWPIIGAFPALNITQGFATCDWFTVSKRPLPTLRPLEGLCCET